MLSKLRSGDPGFKVLEEFFLFIKLCPWEQDNR